MHCWNQQAYLGNESHIPRQVGKQRSVQLLGNLVERKSTARQLFVGSETEETRKEVRFFFFFKFHVVANLEERKRGGERCEFCFKKKKSKLKKQILPKKSSIILSIMKILAVESIRKQNLNSVHGKFEILDLRDKLYT